MPALNYDYDYYEYLNGHRVRPLASNSQVRVNKNINNKPKAVNKKATSKTSSTKKRKTNSIKTTNKTVTKKSKPKKELEMKSRAPNKNIKKPKEMSLTKPKTVTKNKVKQKNIFNKIIFTTILFAVFYMICYRYSMINEKFLEIKKMKSELSEIQAINGQLEAEIENKTDLKYVENYARYQLGMQKPSTSQIKYINVEKQDRISVPVVIEEQKEESFLTKIIKELMKIID